MMTLVATCVGAARGAVEAYDATERTITYRTARKHMGGEAMDEAAQTFGYDRYLHIKNDGCVSYGKGVFRGKRCICIHWSSIHHFYRCARLHNEAA